MHIFTLREAFASLASLVRADFFLETLCWGDLINYHFTSQEDLFRELILARKLVLGEQLVWGQTWFGRNIILGRIWHFFGGKFLEDYLRGKVIFCWEQFLQGQHFKVCLAGCLPDTVQTSHGFFFGTSRKLGVELRNIALRLESNWGLKQGRWSFLFSSHQIDERLRLIETRCFFFLIVGVGSVQAPLFGCKGFEHLDLSKTSHAKGFGLGGLLGFSGLHGLLVESPSQLSPMCCFFFRGTRHRQFYRFLVNMAFSRAGGKKSGLHRSQSKIVGFNIGEKIISAWENWEFSSHTNFTWKEPGCRPWLVNKKKKTRRVGRIYIYICI